jgi:DNA primase
VPLDKAIWLDVYESAVGHPYLKERGISNKTARQLQLMVDTDSAGEERILFPVFDGAGELYGFTGRATRPNAPLKVRDYKGLPKRLLLLGEHLILDTDEYIVLVEGLFDYATLVQCNYPAVAYMSGTVTNAQIQRIKDIGKPVIFFHDNDKTGIEAREKVKEQLCMHVPVLRVTYPKGVRAKDPSDLVEKESVIHKMIQKAKLIV